MREWFRLALVFLFALAAWSGAPNQATAATAALTLDGLASSADVSSLLQNVYHHDIPGEHADRCYVRHLECRYTSGFGHRYRRCMARADCGYRKRFGYGHEPRSCRYWLRRCEENWYYPEDIRGCLRFHGCLPRHSY